MAKFLFYTDLHLSGKSPRHRLDDFPRTMLVKLQEVYEIAEQEGCEFVTFGGDFWNNHHVYSFDVIGRAMDIVCDSGLETYSVVGQHDIHGYNPTTLKTSTLAFFEKRCERFNIMRDPVELDSLVIYPCHVWMDIDDACNQDFDDTKVNILIAHHLLSDKPAMFDVVSTKDIDMSPYEMVLSGDLHDGFEPHKVVETTFCNPGSLARRATNDAPRSPQVVLVDIQKGQDPKVEYRKLKCGLPGDDVLGKSIVEIARETGEFDPSAYVSSMQELEAESTDVHELIQKLGREQKMRKPVLDYLATKSVETKSS